MPISEKTRKLLESLPPRGQEKVKRLALDRAKKMKAEYERREAARSAKPDDEGQGKG